jgi:hypothetical protein
MAGAACSILRQRSSQRKITLYFAVGIASLFPFSAAAAMFPLDFASMFLAACSSMAVGLFGDFLVGRKVEIFDEQQLNTIDIVLDELYPGKQKTIDVQQRWERAIKPLILENAAARCVGSRGGGLASLPVLSKRQASSIESVLTKDVPALRQDIFEYKKQSGR